MNDYYHKIDLTLDNVDLDRLQGEFIELYADTFRHYSIKDIEYLESLIKDKIQFIKPPNIICLAEIIGDGTQPHSDGEIVTLNYYVETAGATTSFWEKKETIDGQYLPQILADGSSNDINVRAFKHKHLIFVDSFTAKENECFLLNIRKIHSVNKTELCRNRYMIRWIWLDMSFEDALNNIQILK